MEGCKVIDAFDHQFVFVGITTRHGRETALMTGSAEVRESPETASVLAVLDATNRWLDRGARVGALQSNESGAYSCAPADNKQVNHRGSSKWRAGEQGRLTDAMTRTVAGGDEVNVRPGRPDPFTNDSIPPN